jgi:multisubunit Na+/H+ antiporter MnhB subunit
MEVKCVVDSAANFVWGLLFDFVSFDVMLEVLVLELVSYRSRADV